jgi:translation initiation factor 2 subunit 2
MDFYSEEHLLNRLYDSIGENGVKGKISMPKPESKIENKKTFLLNFSEIKSKIEREHVTSFVDFLKNDLSVDASINGDNHLVLSGIFRNPSFEKIIKSYCIAYIQCQTCKSGQTEITKEKKIIFMNCHTCKCKRAINQ